MLIDVKHAFRGLKRGAGPLLLSVLSLALGISATTTMIGVVDAIDFRPLPFREPQELVSLAETNAGASNAVGRVSPGVFLDWQQRTRTIDSLAAASSIVVSLQDGERGLDAARVSENFFSTLGVQPALGRTFDAGDSKTDSRVVVISHDAWQSRFAGEADILGRSIRLSWAGEFRSVGAEPYTIVGVLPRGFRYPVGTQVWLPAEDSFGTSRRDANLTVVGRLARDISLTAARAEFDGISRQLATDLPADYAERAAQLSSLRDSMRQSVDGRGAATRLPLLAIAAFVLLLAVINVAGVFLARSAGQMRELRTRLALGASRSRLATLLLTQSLTLAIVAGCLGVLISQWSIQFVSSRLQVAKSGAELILDSRFVLFSLALSLSVGALVALLPLWSVVRVAQAQVLDALSARGISVAGKGRVQKVIVVGQVALAVVLLTGAGVLAQEFLRLATKDTGFDPDRLLVVSLPISMAGAPKAAIAQAQQAERSIAELAGVNAVALGGLPAEGYVYQLEDGNTLSSGVTPTSYRVGPGYFRALRISVSGREFQPSDREGSPPVAIVNRLAADLWWPREEALGRTIFMGRRDGTGERLTVVAVVENERVRRSMTSEMKPVIYRPFGQLINERRQIQVFARVDGRPEIAVASIGRVIDEVYGAGGWRGERIATMESMLGATLAEQRFRALSMSLFSAVGLALATFGIYGVVATIVAQRKAEIGVRVALGASPVQIITFVLRHGAVLAVVGFLLGFVGSAAVNRFLQSLLLEPSGFDVRMPLTSGLILGAAVLLACYFPAQRAARIDSARLLRDV